MKHTFVYSIVLVFVSLVLQTAEARRSIPDNNLCYPVLVAYKNGAATGCFYEVGDSTYFVTAKHVLFSISNSEEKLISDNATLISYPPPEKSGRYKFQVDLKQALENKAIFSHKSKDIAAFIIGKTDSKKPDQINIASYAKVIEKYDSPLILARKKSSKSFEQVLIGNDVILFGYPVSLGLKNIPQLDLDKPLLRKGIVAGKNFKYQTIIIDCPVYQGNSGGPVIEIEQTDNGTLSYNLIGFISQFVPYAEQWVNSAHNYSNVQLSNSGYAVVTPIDALDELLTKQPYNP